MKHNIDVEGLPEGWKAVAYRCPRNYEKFFDGEEIHTAGADMAFGHLIVEKIQPRRKVPDDPLREMKIQQATTGQPVWIRHPSHRFDWDEHLGNVMVYYIKTYITTTPDWHIPNAEYSFTPFEE